MHYWAASAQIPYWKKISEKSQHPQHLSTTFIAQPVDPNVKITLNIHVSQKKGIKELPKEKMNSQPWVPLEKVSIFLSCPWVLQELLHLKDAVILYYLFNPRN